MPPRRLPRVSSAQTRGKVDATVLYYYKRGYRAQTIANIIATRYGRRWLRYAAESYIYWQGTRRGAARFRRGAMGGIADPNRYAGRTRNPTFFRIHFNVDFTPPSVRGRPVEVQRRGYVVDVQGGQTKSAILDQLYSVLVDEIMQSYGTGFRNDPARARGNLGDLDIRYVEAV